MKAIKFSCAFLIIATLAMVTLVDALNPQLVLQLVNEERRNVGALALTLDGRLTQAAQGQANYMASINQMTHDNPAGNVFEIQVTILEAGLKMSFWTRYKWGSGCHANLDEFPGHRKNILNPNYTNMGVAFGGDKYWAQEFARPA
ncbi:5802_t:CDS:2 [Funneliformis caledonium]|uniref:5802_t:CDS:1 n=1 Tax=Funneliformis caledonium TaxID=1117310 RepID=A0A9N9H218_9GLOM|nr:5802_t:CDS:2 [Funneliformis caledonium]